MLSPPTPTGGFVRKAGAVAGSRATCRSRRPPAGVVVARPCCYALLPQRRLVHTTPQRLTASPAVHSLEPEPEKEQTIADADDGPIGEYRRLVHTGQFIDDSFQRLIVARLDRLYRDLLSYTPVKPAPRTVSGVGYLRKVR
ncbi:hypothetical protein GGI20_000873 [Coemansia sp. BCRC 34301]|nr:hypothetical protein GGI20_000873 [Coemansia sp. BCRC 34301]